MHEYGQRIQFILNSLLKRPNSGPWKFKEEKMHLSCYDVKFGCPSTFSAVDVEKQLDALYASCGSPVELIDLAGAVVLRVMFKPLPEKIPFKPVMMKGLKPFELLIGYNQLGERITHDTQRSSQPHMLAGAPTGMGKTDYARLGAYCWLKSGEVEIDFIDMKQISFMPFKGIKGVNIATTFAECYNQLEEAYNLVNDRYELIKKVGNRDLKWSYIPRLIIIDEAAELSPKIFTDPKVKEKARDMERFISTIARLGRECRVHLLYMTQYPTKELVSNQIKINLDARLCLSVSEPVESEVILGRVGAEKLGGMSGRAIFKGKGFHTIQIPYVGSDTEWSNLLAEFKTEVIYSGESKLQGKNPHVVDVDSRSNGATVSEISGGGDATTEEDRLLSQAARDSRIDPSTVFSKESLMESDTEREEAEESNDTEDQEHPSRSSDYDNLS